MAFAALKNNDRAGMLSFTDKVEKIIKPKKGKNNILRIISEILDFNPSGSKTSISTALKALNEIWRRRAVVFLISDFRDGNYSKDLSIAAKKHDLICVKIEDDRETEIPNAGLIEFRDAETGEFFLADCCSAADIFRKKSETFEDNTKKIFQKAKVDVINLNAGRSYVKPLIRFFKERERKKQSGI
jgi:uncharacterized protein (DUF58 family)